MSDALLVFGALERNPDFAMHLGVLTAQYAVLEHSVVEIISLALNENYPAAYAIANKAWQQSARLQLARDLIASASLGPEKTATVLSLLERAEKINVRRNKYIHGLWGVREDSNQVVITSRLYSKVEQREIEIKELATAISEIRELHSEISLWLMAHRAGSN
jgi:hypothetical protein